MKDDIQEVLKSYKLEIQDLDSSLDIKTDALFVLIDRDELQDSLLRLTDEQKRILDEADQMLKERAQLITKILPSKASTPQARAEGRWWWFLNEN